MTLLRVVILAISLVSSAHGSVQYSEVPYRVLYSDIRKPKELNGNLFYAVSVTQNLDRTEIERLVCQVIWKEKPPSFVPRLHISIYYNLDEYIPPAGAPSLEAKLLNHALASYIWNVMLPDVKNRLSIDRDSRGTVLDFPQRYDFDHTKACTPK